MGMEAVIEDSPPSRASRVHAARHEHAPVIEQRGLCAPARLRHLADGGPFPARDARQEGATGGDHRQNQDKGDQTV